MGKIFKGAYIGLCDIKGNKLYEGNTIKAASPAVPHEKYREELMGVITWVQEDCAFMLVEKLYMVGNTPIEPMYYFFEIVDIELIK